MKYRYFNLKKEKNIAFVDLRSNICNEEGLFELTDEFNDLCREIDSNSQIYVMVLKGIETKTFELESVFKRFEKSINKNLQSPACSISKLDRPVIVEMDGNIIWEGFEIALACDIRVAGKNCRFAVPHVQYGLVPWTGTTQRLPRLIGSAKAMELILTAETIDVEKALRIGIVNKIVESEKLSGTVVEIARNMASKGPVALRYAKEAINRGLDLTLVQALRLEADLYFLLHTTAGRMEGIRAFQERRKAHFKGE